MEQAYGAVDDRPQRRKLNPAQVTLATMMAFLPEVAMILSLVIMRTIGRPPSRTAFLILVMSLLCAMMVAMILGGIGGILLFKRGDRVARWAGLVVLALHMVPGLFTLFLLLHLVLP